MEDNKYIPQYGESVEVGDNGTYWYPRVFSEYVATSEYPFKTTDGDKWRYCRKINNQSNQSTNQTTNQTTNQPNKTFMSTIKQTLKNIMRTEPSKTFVKVGFMDADENITEAGMEALQIILWDKYQTELKELADKLNVEEK